MLMVMRHYMGSKPKTDQDAVRCVVYLRLLHHVARLPSQSTPRMVWALYIVHSGRCAGVVNQKRGETREPFNLGDPESEREEQKILVGC